MLFFKKIVGRSVHTIREGYDDVHLSYHSHSDGRPKNPVLAKKNKGFKDGSFSAGSLCVRGTNSQTDLSGVSFASVQW